MTELEFKMRFSDLKSTALSQSHENKGGGGGKERKTGHQRGKTEDSEEAGQ